LVHELVGKPRDVNAPPIVRGDMTVTIKKSTWQICPHYQNYYKATRDRRVVQWG